MSSLDITVGFAIEIQLQVPSKFVTTQIIATVYIVPTTDTMSYCVNTLWGNSKVKTHQPYSQRLLWFQTSCLSLIPKILGRFDPVLRFPRQTTSPILTHAGSWAVNSYHGYGWETAGAILSPSPSLRLAHISPSYLRAISLISLYSVLRDHHSPCCPICSSARFIASHYPFPFRG